MLDDFALEQNLIKIHGFTKERYGVFTHPTGLRVYVDEHRWSCDHDTEGWSEVGILDETDVLMDIFKEYGIRVNMWEEHV